MTKPITPDGARISVAARFPQNVVDTSGNEHSELVLDCFHRLSGSPQIKHGIVVVLARRSRMFVTTENEAVALRGRPHIGALATKQAS